MKAQIGISGEQININEIMLASKSLPRQGCLDTERWEIIGQGTAAEKKETK